MPDAPAPTRPAATPTLRRLNGWKEIAAFVGRGVRTVQRWEKELGLPVRRLGPAGGETVYAFAEEIEAWSLSPSGLSVRDGAGAEGGQLRPKSAWTPAGALTIAALALLAVGVLALALVTQTQAGRAAPDAVAASPTVSVVDGTLVVQEADGRRHQHGFEPPLQACATDVQGIVVPGSVTSARLDRCGDRVLVNDFDGDQRAEVVVVQISGQISLIDIDRERPVSFAVERTVSYFESLNDQRPLPAPRRTRFGPPFRPICVFTARTEGSPIRLWVVATHNQLYPSVLVQLDMTGAAPRVVSEYWSPGHMSALAFGQVAGRPALLAGASHNETGGTSLAVFYGNSPSGSPPSLSGDKRCLDCTGDGPDEFFVFPRSPIVALQNNTAGFWAIVPLEGRGFHVSVSAEVAYDRASALNALAHYTFDANLGLTNGQVGPTYRVRQQQLEQAGSAKGASLAWTDADLFPVLHWTRDRRTFEKVFRSGPTTR